MSGSAGAQARGQVENYTTLEDLLTPASTIPLIDSADTATISRLLSFLPPRLIAMAREADDAISTTSTPIEAPSQTTTLSQQKDVLRRVCRSPQFSQSLSSLTVAVRDGGLPSISEALGISVRNGGYMRRGGVPLGGAEAVEAFLDGVRQSAQSSLGDRMNT